MYKYDMPVAIMVDVIMAENMYGIKFYQSPTLSVLTCDMIPKECIVYIYMIDSQEIKWVNPNGQHMPSIKAGNISLQNVGECLRIDSSKIQCFGEPRCL